MCRGPQRQLRYFHDSLVSAVKQNFPTKEHRKALQVGDVVIRLTVASSDHEAWFHLSWCNMNTWHMVFLPLQQDHNERRVARAAPGRALVAKAAEWMFSWNCLRMLDIQASWSVDFWRLQGSPAQLHYDLEPWAVQVQQAGPTGSFWHGPRPPRRRPPGSPRARPPGSPHARPLQDEARGGGEDSAGGASRGDGHHDSGSEARC